MNWISLTNKYNTRCIQCGLWIPIGTDILWQKGIGVKHHDCLSDTEDKSQLVIIDDFFEEQKYLKGTET